jgi:hypothetical protein
MRIGRFSTFRKNDFLSFAHRSSHVQPKEADDNPGQKRRRRCEGLQSRDPVAEESLRMRFSGFQGEVKPGREGRAVDSAHSVREDARDGTTLRSSEVSQWAAGMRLLVQTLVSRRPS